MPLSGTLSATRRAGTGYQFDRYHTLATFVPTQRKCTPLSAGSSGTDTAAPSPPVSTGNGNCTASQLPTQHFDYANRFGDSSSLATVMVGGSPKRYPTCVNPSARGQNHHRHQHRGRVKMTKTVSDLNLARHLVNGSPSARPVEQIYATVDRASTTAATTKRHLVANYGGGGSVSPTTTTERDKGTLVTSSTQLGKSLQAFPDTVV